MIHDECRNYFLWPAQIVPYVNFSIVRFTVPIAIGPLLCIHLQRQYIDFLFTVNTCVLSDEFPHTNGNPEHANSATLHKSKLISQMKT